MENKKQLKDLQEKKDFNFMPSYLSFKNQNQTHNIKKQAQGENTKR